MYLFFFYMPMFKSMLVTINPSMSSSKNQFNVSSAKWLFIFCYNALSVAFQSRDTRSMQCKNLTSINAHYRCFLLLKHLFLSIFFSEFCDEFSGELIVHGSRIYETFQGDHSLKISEPRSMNEVLEKFFFCGNYANEASIQDRE